MDAARFDAVIRLLGATSSRRAALAGIAAAIVVSGRAGAKKKNPKPVRNAFGCVDVGRRCFGKDDVCCSGRCAGTKPKKRKQDKRRCAAHDASTCQAGDDACNATIVACTTTPGNPAGECLKTTGNAPFCTSAQISCRQCSKDAECVAACGAGAACVQCDGASIGCFAVADSYCVRIDRDCDP